MEAVIYIIRRWSMAVEGRHKFRAAVSQVDLIEVGHFSLTVRGFVTCRYSIAKLLECPY